MHLNGTGKQELVDQLAKANDALGLARRALADAAPNGRDYYPQGDDAIREATREHRVRLRLLETVQNEVVEILTAVVDAP